ncbi:hypothetical protein BASA61_001659 [Batrachochytrium salamandrivorans]|nr:hypothetical protein BASA61_001659 [Batrachochytrium salamandrivorans]
MVRRLVKQLPCYHRHFIAITCYNRGNSRSYSTTTPAASISTAASTASTTTTPIQSYSFPTTTIRALLADPSQIGKQVTVNGWVRSQRSQKTVSFIDLDDGSSLAGLQVVIDASLAKTVYTGSSLKVVGILVATPDKPQPVDLEASSIVVLGACDPQTYPLHKTRLPLDHLRENQHLRARTRIFGALWRVRSAALQGIHDFFKMHEFMQINMPIITLHDCEGGGEAFRVLTDESLLSHKAHAVRAAERQHRMHTPPSMMASMASTDRDTIQVSPDPPDEFFGKPVYMTVSAQLHAEFMASSLSRVYVLGPTFRAEKSQSTRHLAEFWMLEAEACFLPSLYDLTLLIEATIQHVIRHVLKECPDDLALFDQFIERGIVRKLEDVVGGGCGAFQRMSYTDAVKVLIDAEKGFSAAGGVSTRQKWQFPIKWGAPLQSEHEKFLAQVVVGGPVFVTDYPKHMKPFYMKSSDVAPSSAEMSGEADAHETVACTDLLMPKMGELVGGSLREDNYDILLARIIEAGLDPVQFQWYLDLRKYGGVPHGGYGMGFERFLGYVTGIANLRDLIPAPRSYGQCRF